MATATRSPLVDSARLQQLGHPAGIKVRFAEAEPVVAADHKIQLAMLQAYLEQGRQIWGCGGEYRVLNAINHLLRNWVLPFGAGQLHHDLAGMDKIAH